MIVSLKKMNILRLMSFALLATQVTTQEGCIDGVLRLPLDPDTDTIEEFLEYCYNGEWSRICTNGNWGNSETRTRVACGQLGYSEENASVRHSICSDPTIVNDTFVSVSKCSEDHKTLQECGVNKTVNGCLCTTMSNQVQLICYRATCPKERVRLVATEHHDQEGLVEVCSDGRWGTVQTSQPQQVAREVCRRLGRGELNETNFSTAPSRSSKPVYNCSILWGSLTCEESIYNDHNFDLRVSCAISNKSCDGQVRLTDGYSYREGRVEVCVNGEWGSVYNFGQKGIPGAACYQAGFLREGAMATSYGEDTEGGYCCSNTMITLHNCDSCTCSMHCNILGVVCQAWDHSQPTNNSSECTIQPPLIEPTSTSTTAPSITSLNSTTTTLNLGTEHVASTQLTSTSPDNNTVVLGAIIGVLLTLLLATLVGWMCTCLIMHRNNTTKAPSSSTNNPITTDDNYSLGQLVDCVYDEATPTKPPPTYNPPLPQATNPPLVTAEASKGEDEFYNAEQHMYTAIDKKKKQNNAEADGEGENKTEESSNQPVYDVAMPGEAVWGVEGSDEYSRLKH